jgi:hypothetical protein
VELPQPAPASRCQPIPSRVLSSVVFGDGVTFPGRAPHPTPQPITACYWPRCGCNRNTSVPRHFPVQTATSHVPVSRSLDVPRPPFPINRSLDLAPVAGTCLSTHPSLPLQPVELSPRWQIAFLPSSGYGLVVQSHREQNQAPADMRGPSRRSLVEKKGLSTRLHPTDCWKHDCIISSTHDSYEPKSSERRVEAFPRSTGLIGSNLQSFLASSSRQTS